MSTARCLGGSSCSAAILLAPPAIAGAGFGLQEDPTAAATLQHVPSERSISGRNVSYVAYLLGITAGVTVVSGVWQHRFVTAANEALSRDGLSPEAHRLSADLASGGVSGDPSASITGRDAEQIRTMVHTAFTMRSTLPSSAVSRSP
ncbi:hypothetical protein [Actinomadura madurae]|uniref:hypothetical protein n=1 Tax=Actinomadura madurae TaxID=1993 RepID=UPI000D868987|nr:hypothetical protein [Actinomadura madurae]SPT51450.1 Uncharacterised protein [Actinomadura madurae]